MTADPHLPAKIASCASVVELDAMRGALGEMGNLDEKAERLITQRRQVLRARELERDKLQRRKK